MSKTYNVSEDFIKEAHKAACKDWKKKIEEKFPEAFNPKVLEVGNWYISNKNRSLFFVTEVNKEEGTRGDCKAYGFNMNGEWRDEKWGFACHVNNDGYQKLPSVKEIKDRLIEEAKRRGLITGIFLKSPFCADKERSPFQTTGDYIFNVQQNSLELGGVGHGILTLFKNGVWVEPCDIPTQEEINRVLTYLNSISK